MIKGDAIAEALASRIVLLARGCAVAEGSPSELSAQARAAGFEEAFLALTGGGP